MLFRYPGGKGKLAKPILRAILEEYERRPFSEYCEPFFGGGGVCFALLRVLDLERVWINDLDPGVYAVWWAVFNRPDELKRVIQEFVPSRTAYDQCRRLLLSGTVDTQCVQTALAKVALHQMSFSGLGLKAGGPMGEIASRWSVPNLQSQIDDANRLLTRRDFVLTRRDYRRVLSACGDDTLAYVDPPYYEKGSQLYQYAFGEKQHQELRDLLRGSKFPWVLSYDNHPEIRKLYPDCNLSEIPVSYTINGGVSSSELLVSRLRGPRVSDPSSGLLQPAEGL